jgi:hypothetical protein
MTSSIDNMIDSIQHTDLSQLVASATSKAKWRNNKELGSKRGGKEKSLREISSDRGRINANSGARVK